MKIQSITTALSIVLLTGRAYAQVPTLINGSAADPKDFPASVYIQAGNGFCTATVIGERVVITASHCMNNGGTITFSAGGSKYAAKCTHHPEYNSNSTADWALCLTDKPVTGIEYENLNTDTAIVGIGDELLLTGYGCTGRNGDGGNDGVYRTAKSKVTGLPSGNNYDIVTAIRGGGALCFGDSGGPAFFVDEDGRRKMVSVNSRGDIAVTSYLPLVALQPGIDWVNSWAAAKSAKICGVHADAVSCRDAAPVPSTAQCDAMMAAKSLETWKSCLAGGMEDNLPACETAVDEMGRCYLSRYRK